MNQKVASPSFIFDVTDAQAQQMVELSHKVPVVIDLWAAWCAPCRKLTPILEKLIEEHEGKVALCKIDVDNNRGAAQAFKAQSIPTVVGLVKGRPVEMFVGALPKAHIQQYFEEFLKLAQKHDVTDELELDEQADSPFKAEENPLALEAKAAVENKDYQRAASLYQTLLDSNPADVTAKQGLAQTKLLERVQEFNAEEVRHNAAQASNDIQAQLDVSDLDMVGGHVQDAFNRLIDLTAVAQGQDKEVARQRLLEYFDVVGANDTRVAQARLALARSLF